MGRRKIEIQAIQNERNRSVTFIKRKNGLFKKAYELGVLCSVDVAVIIFDERPGHSRKLYEYSSCDIRNIIQRHIRHDGETDSRTTADFSGNAPASKDDEDGDDDVDEDDAVLLASMKTGGSKRRDDGSLKSGPGQDIHPGYPRSGHSQEIIELSPRNPSPQLYTDQRSSIPISSDRLRPAHDHQNKKPRLHLPSMDLIQRQPYSRSGSPSSGPPSPLLEGTGAGYSYPQQFHNPQLDLPQSNQRYAHHQNQHQYSQYAPLFPLRQSRGPTPPPPSFVPLHSDFSLSGNARQGDTRGVPAYPPPGSWGSGGTDRGSRSGRSGGGVTADLFAALLDAREEGRATDRRGQFALPPGLAVTSSTFGIDWPVHNQGGGENMGPASAVSSIGSGGGDGASSGGRSSTGASATDWLDFLSGNSGVAAPPPSAVSARGMGAPWAHSADSMSMDSDGELFSGMGHGMEGQGVKKEVPG